MILPQMLNIGSGKNFRPDCLNIDISAFWEPDILHDLNLPLLADNLLTITALAATCPLLIAPAMDGGRFWPSAAASAALRTARAVGEQHQAADLGIGNSHR